MRFCFGIFLNGSLKPYEDPDSFELIIQKLESSIGRWFLQVFQKIGWWKNENKPNPVQEIMLEQLKTISIHLTFNRLQELTRPQI